MTETIASMSITVTQDDSGWRVTDAKSRLLQYAKEKVNEALRANRGDMVLHLTISRGASTDSDGSCGVCGKDAGPYFCSHCGAA